MTELLNLALLPEGYRWSITSRSLQIEKQANAYTWHRTIYGADFTDEDETVYDSVEEMLNDRSQFLAQQLKAFLDLTQWKATIESYVGYYD